METELLQKEGFEAMKVLADIQSQIALAKAEIVNLSVEKDVYLQEREVEAQARVVKVLDNLKDTFLLLDKNVNDLLSFKDGVISFRDYIIVLSEEVKSFSYNFRKKLEESKNIIENKTIELISLQESINKQKDLLKLERENLSSEKNRLEEEALFLKDQRGAFERVWLELESKLKN